MTGLRHVARAGIALAACTVGACSVADNLSSAEMLTEVSGIVKVEQTDREHRLVYRDRATVSSWYMRSFLFVPVRPVLGFVFGGSHDAELDNPGAHVRTLLQELPDETGGDLRTCIYSAIYCAWIAELDTHAHNRIVAMDGLAAMVQQLDLPLFDGDFAQFGVPLDPARAATARAGIQLGRPDVRGEGPIEASRLQTYVAALRDVTSAPLDTPVARLSLLEDLNALHELETNREARAVLVEALRAALRHVAEGVLTRIVAGRDPEYVELRLCAMEQIRRLGGPRTVPLLLAVMRPTGAAARGDAWFDPDPMIRLRLIHYCGQLAGDVATTEVALPGHSAVPLSPREFLVMTILQEQAHYSKLRTPALVALTWSLRRPRLDPSLAWVQEWWDQQR